MRRDGTSGSRRSRTRASCSRRLRICGRVSSLQKDAEASSERVGDTRGLGAPAQVLWYRITFSTLRGPATWSCHGCTRQGSRSSNAQALTCALSGTRWSSSMPCNAMYLSTMSEGNFALCRPEMANGRFPRRRCISSQRLCCTATCRPIHERLKRKWASMAPSDERRHGPMPRMYSAPSSSVRRPVHRGTTDPSSPIPPAPSAAVHQGTEINGDCTRDCRRCANGKMRSGREGCWVAHLARSTGIPSDVRGRDR